MKSHLYAVHINAKWQWHVTLDIHTDIHYWFGQYGSNSGILMLDPFLSLGQAWRIRNQMTPEHTQNEFPTPFSLHSDPWNTSASSTQAPLTALTRKMKDIAARCGIGSRFTDRMRLIPISFDAWKEGAFPELPLEQSTYNQIVGAISGRALLVEEVGQLLEHLGFDPESFSWTSYVQLAHLQGDLTITSGLEVEERRELATFWKKSTNYTCKRCGSGKSRMFWSSCVFCGDECPYCEECLTMGRTRYCSLLILGNSLSVERKLMRQAVDYHACISPWGLSSAQEAASLEGLRFIDRDEQAIERPRANRPSKFLIWAVTGAGKTEMIFPFIQHVTASGGKVLVATPRKDVVLELQPRIMKAFAGSAVVTLYGGSEQRWEQGEITIATTHQLLRFHEAFDLVIIDEIDAFPYHNNPVLEYAARKVCHPSGSYILLSATPPGPVRKAAERGRLSHVKVPVRFHRHPLPVPELVSTPTLQQMVRTGKLPAALRTRLQVSAERGAQIFVFVPSIKLVEPMVQMLRREIRLGARGGFAEDRASLEGTLSAEGAIEGTSSKDPLRTEKVLRFRDRVIRLLVTTTILERGVTVPKSDVFILDSDSQLFDEAALVQMSGRAGRSKEDPAGKVYFTAKEKTKSQSEAIKQIKNMNRLARKQGYFKGDNH